MLMPLPNRFTELEVGLQGNVQPRALWHTDKAAPCAGYLRYTFQKGAGPARPCLLDNLRLMHNMGETIVAIDNIPCYHIVRRGRPRNGMILP